MYNNALRPNFSSIPPVTKNLLIVNGIMWLACMVFKSLESRVDLMNLFGLHYFPAESFMPHQLVTYMFLHDTSSMSHLFFNMFGLFMFGRTLEAVWGSRQFFIYYMVTGIGAGLIQQLVWYLTVPANEFVPGINLLLYDALLTVGASGALFGILLAFGVIFPNAGIYIMFIPIAIKAKYLVIGYGLMELMLGFGNRPGDNVAHFAHLGGMLFGAILLLYWRKKGKMYGQRYR